MKQTAVSYHFLEKNTKNLSLRRNKSAEKGYMNTYNTTKMNLAQ